MVYDPDKEAKETHLVIGSHSDRDTFRDSVERFINDGGIPDKAVENKFIAWCREMFRPPRERKIKRASMEKVGNMIKLVEKIEEDSYGL